MEKDTLKIISDLEEKRRLSRVLKRDIRKIKENKIMLSEDSYAAYASQFTSSGEHTLVYNMFVQPFVDVLKAAKLVAMDLSNSIQLAWNALTIVDQDDLIDEIENFNEKRQEINKDWEPLLKKVDQLIGSQDPIYKLSLLGPEAFYALEGLGVGLASGKTIAEILTAIRWEKLKDNFKTRLSPEENLTRNSRRIQILHKKMLRKLNKLFFIKSSNQRENIENDEDILNEAVGEEQMTEKDAVDEFLRITGLKISLEEIKISNSENLITASKNINQKISPLLYASELLSATTIEDLVEVFKKMKSAGAQLNISIDNISRDIDTQTTKLLNNKDYIEKLKAEKIEENKIQETAKNTVFNASKEEINVKIIQEIKKMLPEIDKSILALGVDSDILGLMKKDSDSVVRTSANIYENLLNSYKDIKNNFKRSTI